MIILTTEDKERLEMMEAILDALKCVKPEKGSDSICLIIRRWVSHVYPHLNIYEVGEVLCDVMKGWPKHSGRRCYPITTTDRDDAHWEYGEAEFKGTLWDKDTEYGRLRWELYEWLIDTLEEGLEQLKYSKEEHL